MAFDYQLSFTVDENGVSYTDGNTDILANTSAGTFDPSVTGRDAPIGSQFLRTNGTLYLKYGPATTNWRRIAQAPLSSTNDVWVSKVGDDTTGDGSFDNPYLTVKKGVQAALAIVAVTPQPVLVKVLAGVYDEVNPIAMSGTNCEYISVQGDQENITIVRPTVNADLFTMTSNTVGLGPSLFNMLIDCSSLPAFKTSNRSAVTTTGPGRFVLNGVNIKSAGIGYNTGNGTSTNQEAIYDFATIENCTTGVVAKGDGVQANQSCFFRDNATGLAASGNVEVEVGNFRSLGGVGFNLSNNAVMTATTGVLLLHTTGLITNDTSKAQMFACVFDQNTTDFNQVDGTSIIVITGRLAKEKQLITNGANVSINYIDESSRDFIVGNADVTGDPGKEFRVRDFDGRVAIGDEATNANIASGGVGGSRTINLIDTNGNMRVWRFVSDAGVDPAVELIKGINPANTDGDGDAPIVSITAGTDTIVIDVSGTDFNDPLATPPGIDRTTLATRAFPAGRVFRVNGTASNNGNYTVSSATYNSGPQTISIVVTTDITVTEGAVGTVVFGGGAGRTDGVSTYVGDPGAAVAAGAGNVWWDTFIQEDDHFVIRRRTGGGGDPDNEKVRVYRDRSEWLGSSTYSDSDGALIAVLQHNANAVNYLTLQNSISTAPVVISALGTDTDVSFNMIPKNAGVLNLRSSGAFAPAMRFYDADSSNYTGIKAANTTTANVTYSLPPADGTSGQVLSTNGTGTLSWATAAGGGGTVTSVSGGGTGLTFTNPTTTPTMTGTLIAANGGTGFATYTVGDILYADTTATLAKLADVATGNALISGGVGVAPLWGKIGLTTHVTGTLPIANGGTATTTVPTNGQLLIGNGTGYTVASLTAGTGISITPGAGTLTIATTGLQTSLQLYRENPSTPTTPTASGTNAVAIGNASVASGQESIVLGGLNNTSSAQWSVSSGSRAVARLYGARASASGRITADGDAQNIRLVARATTTNTAATTPLFLDGAGATQRMVLQNNSAWTFEILVVARQVGANNAAGYRFQGVIRRDGAAAVTFVGTPSKTLLGENVGTWDANVTADSGNSALNINVNGTATATINWVATINIAEVIA